MEEPSACQAQAPPISWLTQDEPMTFQVPDSDSAFGADILRCGSHVRFTPESGHVQRNSPCLLWAKSGHASATPAPGMLPSVCHHIVVRHHPNLPLKRRGGAATWTKKPRTSMMETTTGSRRSSRIISTRI